MKPCHYFFVSVLNVHSCIIGQYCIIILAKGQAPQDFMFSMLLDGCWQFHLNINIWTSRNKRVIQHRCFQVCLLLCLYNVSQFTMYKQYIKKLIREFYFATIFIEQAISAMISTIYCIVFLIFQHFINACNRIYCIGNTFVFHLDAA